MLIRAQRKPQEQWNRYLEEVIRVRLKEASTIPFERYIQAGHAAQIMQINPKQIKDFLVLSKTVHGVLFSDGQLLVHPIGLLEEVKKRNINILRTLRKTGA